MTSETVYNISELSSLTGINSITLRAWERRYGLLRPERTPKGHRIYREHDIKLIREIRFWLEKGIAISKVKHYLANMHQEVSAEPHRFDEAITKMLSAASHFDSVELSSCIDEVFSLYPMDIIAEQFLPALEKTMNDYSLVSKAPHAEYSYLTIELKQRLRHFVDSQKSPKIKAKILLVKTEYPYDRLDLLLLAAMLCNYNYRCIVIEVPIEFVEVPTIMKESRSEGVILFSNHTGPSIAAAQNLHQTLGSKLLVISELPGRWSAVNTISVCEKKLNPVLKWLNSLA